MSLRDEPDINYKLILKLYQNNNLIKSNLSFYRKISQSQVIKLFFSEFIKSNCSTSN